MFLNELAEDDKNNILRIAMDFRFTSSNKLIDVIHAFFERMFKPLIDFVNDEISKEIMTMETTMHQTGTQINQNIQNNYGTANVGESITSNNTVTQNDLQQLVN